MLKRAAWRWLVRHPPMGRRALMALRFEMESLAQRCANFLNPSYHRKIAALRRMDGVSVNFGSGGRGATGWINIDIISLHADQYVAHDLRRPLPFRDSQVKRIFAEHVIEHLDFRHDVPGLFAEFHRILEPGGVLRIIVPDLERFLHAYVTGSREEFRALGWDLDQLPHDIHTPMHVLNHMYHQEGEHLFGWDYATMEWALRRAGFGDVSKQSYGVSLDSGLALDRPEHAPYSLYVEAVKQAASL